MCDDLGNRAEWYLMGRYMGSISTPLSEDYVEGIYTVIDYKPDNIELQPMARIEIDPDFGVLIGYDESNSEICRYDIVNLLSRKKIRDIPLNQDEM